MSGNSFVAGRVLVELVSADIPNVLKTMNDRGIELSDLEYLDDLTVRVSVALNQYPILKNLSPKKDVKVRLIQKTGLIWNLSRAIKRPVLLVGLLLLLMAAMYLPTRVFFVKVEGNRSLPTSWILEKASECGIGFGSSRSQIRSEQMKNRLLSAIPQLEWAGVNTEGCVAVISVKEKSMDMESDTGSTAGGIVASRDGIIRSCTVSKGNGLCSVGQAVKAGQMLISGYQDCGLLIKFTGAEGEVYADTDRKLTAFTPTERIKRGEERSVRKGYSILIGKNLIKLYNDSGICDTTCVKMYEEYYMSLPGGFQLPLAVVCETWICYDTEPVCDEEASAYSWVSDAAETYLLDSMIAGQIITKNVRQEFDDGRFQLFGHYACNEMIGKEIDGENKFYDGENN